MLLVCKAQLPAVPDGVLNGSMRAVLGSDNHQPTLQAEPSTHHAFMKYVTNRSDFKAFSKKSLKPADRYQGITY